jgi:hypothetical protein
MPVPTLAQLASRFEDVAAAGRRAALVPAGMPHRLVDPKSQASRPHAGVLITRASLACTGSGLCGEP